MQIGQFARIAQNYAVRVSEFVRKAFLARDRQLATESRTAGEGLRAISSSETEPTPSAEK